VGITIGRFGRSPAGAGLEVDVQSFRQSGDTITVGGDLMPAAGDADPINTMRAMRAQLAGLASDGGDGEDMVPVVWADDPHYTGVYRVLNAEVTATDVTLAAGRALWQATLQRVVHSSSPWTETRTTVILLPNAHGFVPVANLVGSVASIPGSVVEFETVGGVLYSTPASGADGNELRIGHGPGGISDTIINETYRYAGPIADWYLGACTVEGQWGSNWWPVIGRQATADLSAVRIRNGQVRVTPVAAGLTVEWWGGASWVSSFTARLSDGHAVASPADFTLLRNVAVLRNSPEAVTVRCSYSTTAVTPSTYKVDLTIRRGTRVVTVVVSRFGASGMRGARLDFGTNLASTAVTSVTAGTIRRTANDGAGNRPVLMCADANTQDLTNGRLTSGTLPAVRFGIGCEIPGATVTQPDRALDQAGSFFQPLAQRSVTVGR
jgi:hypothetical protein